MDPRYKVVAPQVEVRGDRSDLDESLEGLP